MGGLGQRLTRYPHFHFGTVVLGGVHFQAGVGCDVQYLLLTVIIYFLMAVMYKLLTVVIYC